MSGDGWYDDNWDAAIIEDLREDQQEEDCGHEDGDSGDVDYTILLIKNSPFLDRLTYNISYNCFGEGIPIFAI